MKSSRGHSPRKDQVPSNDENVSEPFKEGLSHKLNTDHIMSSPSRSVKNFFTGRNSTYSINSAIDTTASESSLSSPTKSISKYRTAESKLRISGLLKPKFSRSKSSFTVSSTGSRGDYPNVRSSTNLPNLKATAEADFADTSSDYSKDSKAFYDAESINSILDEYEDREESRKTFLFQENFDDTHSTIGPEHTKKLSIINSSRNSSHTITRENSIRSKSVNKSIIGITLEDSKLSNSSSSSNQQSIYTSVTGSPSSSRFKIFEDKSEGSIAKKQRNQKNVNKRQNVVSTSSNIDINRSSLINLSTVSDLVNRTPEIKNEESKYPDPNITPQNASRKSYPESRRDPDRTNSTHYNDSSISERPLATQIINESTINFNETVLKENRDKRITIASSISSGELLSKLESFYDKDLSSRTNFPQNTSTNNDTDIRVKTALPISVNRVHARPELKTNGSKPSINLSEHSKAKLVETGSSKEVQSPQNVYLPPSDIGSIGTVYSSFPTHSHSSKSASSNKEFIQSNLNQHLGDFRHSKSWAAVTSPTSIPKPPSKLVLSDNLTKKNSHDYLLDAPSPTYHGASASSSSSEYPIDLEKQNEPKKISCKTTHSWTHFILIMVLCLVVPPVYFLISLGVFDWSGSHHQSYNGLFYKLQNLNDYSVNPQKAFSKTQKIISFVIGILWFIIVLAMVALGLSLTITRGE